MVIWMRIFRGFLVLLGLALVGFNAWLYLFCKQQKGQIEAMNEQQKTQMQVISNKFQDQQDHLERLHKDLQDAQQQIKEDRDSLEAQKDALLQEVEKRQGVENQGKGIQKSLVDIKAEADAIKHDMKGWQKDYVAVLAELERKMDDGHQELKDFEKTLTDLNIPDLRDSIKALKDELQSLTRPAPITAAPADSGVPEKKAERADIY